MIQQYLNFTKCGNILYMETDDNEYYSKLYKYWDQLNPIKYVNKSQYEIMNHPIRDAIVKVLRRGIVDKNQKNRKRHVLSMQELLNEVNELLSHGNEEHENLKNTRLYYHVDILITNNIIQEATVIKIGRHYQAYYCRTAKGFILLDEDYSLDRVKFNQMHSSLIAAINDDIEEKNVKSLLNTIEKKNKEILNLRDSWITENANLISRLDIDMIDFVKIIEWYYYVHPDLLSLYQKLGKMLRLPGF